MPRYFLEVSYKGTGYAGFQVQQNANTVQAEVEKALSTYFRFPISLTGSSRTDTGVHALQNYFHFDTEQAIEHSRSVYHLNAILPLDIAVKRIFPVDVDAHCRFDASSRSYRYYIYQSKDPFLQDRAYYYPYLLDLLLLNEAASTLLGSYSFESFSKKNVQVKTFDCTIFESSWVMDRGMLVYHVIGNRFLRGMVRGLVGTMLGVGRKRISVEEFVSIREAGQSARVDFSTPARGLFLEQVNFEKPSIQP
jgi:tRNA pseudouridine38-40 synthase